MEEAKLCLEDAKEMMQMSIEHLDKELTKVRAGKATPQMLDSVFVDYYGTNTVLSQVANINTPDARTIVIQPWEKSLLNAIDKAILAANLGFNPQNDGEVIRVVVPPLTEERRRDLVKKAKIEAENARIAIRNIRRDANDEAKKLEKNGLAEDMRKKLEADIQTATNEAIAKVDKVFEAKEKDIMTV